MQVVNTPPHASLARVDNLCALCSTVMDNAYPCYLLSCKHVFHKNCIDAWLTENSEYFTCRVEINREELRVVIDNCSPARSQPVPSNSKAVPAAAKSKSTARTSIGESNWSKFVCI